MPASADRHVQPNTMREICNALMLGSIPWEQRGPPPVDRQAAGGLTRPVTGNSFPAARTT